MHKIIIFTYLFFLNSFYSHGHDYSKAGIKIDHPVLQVVKLNSKVGAGYMNIINNTKKKVKLLDIEASIAKTQEIHEIILDNDVYKMRPIKDGVPIMSNEKLEFKSKSYHFMFFDINKNLKEDEMLEAKLIFNDNIIIPIKFKVVIGFKDHNH